MDEVKNSLAPVHVSIVSHGHGDLVLRSLECLAQSLGTDAIRVRVWLTLNLPEPDLQAVVSLRTWPFEVTMILNDQALGFGKNHNQAFRRASAAGRPLWFVVMNPDIFWPAHAEAFWANLANDRWPQDVGLVCPRQIDNQAQAQDFARHLMTPWSLAWRVVRRALSLPPAGVAVSVDAADWVNGACMVWRVAAFEQIGGFDERYFMYCEDTDICLRSQLANWRKAGSDLSVVHDARRNTGRSLQHLRWHVRSMWRLWCSSSFWQFLLSNRMK